MKSLTEISTLLTNDLQDLNQEIRLKLLFMPSYTEQEMKNLGLWLEEVEQLARNLENLSLIIYHHSQLLKTEYQMRLQEDTSLDLTVEDSKSDLNIPL